MKNRIILIIFGALIALIAVSCAANQISWSVKENAFDPTREVVGLPSIAIGNLSPSARVPGLDHYVLASTIPQEVIAATSRMESLSLVFQLVET